MTFMLVEYLAPVWLDDDVIIGDFTAWMGSLIGNFFSDSPHMV
jgi:hypothetical protein